MEHFLSYMPTVTRSTMDIIFTLFLLCKRCYTKQLIFIIKPCRLHVQLNVTQLELCTPMLVNKILAHFKFCYRKIIYSLQTCRFHLSTQLHM